VTFEDIVLASYTPAERHEADALAHGLELQRRAARRGRPLRRGPGIGGPYPDHQEYMRRFWGKRLSGQEPEDG
jgi:hypothetical protein